MKHKALILTFTAVVAIGLAGCSKSEPITPADADADKAASSAADAADKTAEAAKVDAAKAAEAAKVEAAKVAKAAKVEAAKVAEATTVAADAKAAEVAKAADAAKAANATMVQGLVDKAQGLVAEGKFSDASSVLQQLAGKTLSNEQTRLVAAMKEQIQKGLAAKAAENARVAAANLLK